MEPQTLLFDALIPSLEEVGARFERGDFFVPEMLIAGRAMAGAMELLRPLLAETGVADHRQVPDGHGQGRRPRHRQEPRQHHARGRRLRGDRPRRPGGAGEVRGRDRGAPARHRRLLGVPHHDDADVQGQHERAGRRPASATTSSSWSAAPRSPRSTPTPSAPTGTPPTPRRRSSAPRRCSTRSARRCPALSRPALAGDAARDRAPLGHAAGGHRPRHPLLPDRRADQPDRAPHLPGAAARRRPVRDRARRARPGRGRRRRARHQHGRPADRRGRPAGQGHHHGPGAHRQADLHRLLGRGGAGGRAVGLPGPGPGQLDHRRGRADGADPPAGQEVRRRRHRAAQRLPTRSRWRSRSGSR